MLKLHGSETLNNIQFMGLSFLWRRSKKNLSSIRNGHGLLQDLLVHSRRGLS